MANGKILRQLIKAGTTSDSAAFRRVSEAIIEEKRQKQHHLLANDLEHILDSAIWRRFDEVIEFPLPNESQLTQLLKLKLRGIRRQFELNDDELLSCFVGKSGADIERIIRKAIKRMILRSQEFLTVKNLKNALAGEKLRTTQQG
ncbi:hypothetical protein [Photorhabdus stackebrandtii]|uniref:hypothetical protein n=1 Tax=Photorhabdus stackebrandtii TaxID=1123042 RepID=UPI001F622A39|nr:hypothetical protein [Photorhabdus stackebrandtii]